MKSRSISLLYDSPISFSGQFAATELIRRTLEPAGWSFDAFEFPALDRTAGRLARYGTYAFRTLACWARIATKSLKESPILYINLPQSRAAFAKMGPPVLFIDRLRPDVKKIVSLHGSIFMGWTAEQPEAKAFLRILHTADVVTVLGPVQRARLVEWGIEPDRVRMVSNPSEFDALDPDLLREKQAAGPPEAPVTLLHLSLLIESKGFPEFLEALALLAQRPLRRPIRAVLCGPMSFTAFCTRFTTEASKASWIEEHVAKINASEQVSVEWVRGARGEAKQALFNAAQVFVFPSRFPVEAQPLVLLEAMASGCAVISSQVGEIPSTLPEGGALLLESCTPAEIADHVETLIDDPALRLRLAERGLEAVTTRFSPDRYRQTWDAILRGLTGDSAAPISP